MTHEKGKAELVRALKIACLDAGGQSMMAAQLGISPSMMSAMLSGAKRVPDPVLTAVGYERITVYRKIRKPKPAAMRPTTEKTT